MEHWKHDLATKEGHLIKVEHFPFVFKYPRTASSVLKSLIFLSFCASASFSIQDLDLGKTHACFMAIFFFSFQVYN